MEKEDCETLEKVYRKPPPGIPWADIRSLFNTIADEHNGTCDYSPGKYIILRLPQKDEEDMDIYVPYVSTVYSTLTRRIELRLVLVGITKCP